MGLCFCRLPRSCGSQSLALGSSSQLQTSRLYNGKLLKRSVVIRINDLRGNPSADPRSNHTNPLAGTIHVPYSNTYIRAYSSAITNADTYPHTVALPNTYTPSIIDRHSNRRTDTSSNTNSYRVSHGKANTDTYHVPDDLSNIYTHNKGAEPSSDNQSDPWPYTFAN